MCSDFSAPNLQLYRKAGTRRSARWRRTTNTYSSDLRSRRHTRSNSKQGLNLFHNIVPRIYLYLDIWLSGVVDKIHFLYLASFCDVMEEILRRPALYKDLWLLGNIASLSLVYLRFNLKCRKSLLVLTRAH